MRCRRRHRHRRRRRFVSFPKTYTRVLTPDTQAARCDVACAVRRRDGVYEEGSVPRGHGAADQRAQLGAHHDFNARRQVQLLHAAAEPAQPGDGPQGGELVRVRAGVRDVQDGRLPRKVPPHAAHAAVVEEHGRQHAAGAAVRRRQELDGARSAWHHHRRRRVVVRQVEHRLSAERLRGRSQRGAAYRLGHHRMRPQRRRRGRHGIHGHYPVQGLPFGYDDRTGYAAAFFTELREHPALRNAWFIFVCERNTGYEAGSLKEVLTRVDAKNISVKERSDRDFGWWTTSNMKMAYGTTTRKALGLKTVRFMKNWVACSRYGDNKLKSTEQNRNGTKEELGIELGNVRVVNKLTEDPSSHDRAFISGKSDDRGKVRRDQNDDLFIALGLALFVLALYLKGKIPNFNHRRVIASYGSPAVQQF